LNRTQVFLNQSYLGSLKKSQYDLDGNTTSTQLNCKRGRDIMSPGICINSMQRLARIPDWIE
jgi:hypothetical protein